MYVNKGFVLHVFVSCFVREVLQLLELRRFKVDARVRSISGPRTIAVADLALVVLVVRLT